MDRTIVARLLRSLLVACFVAVVFPVVVGGLGVALAPTQAAVLLPFVAATIGVGGLGSVLAGVNRLVRRLGHDSTRTPYSALAEAAARIRAGSLDDALPGLARVVGEGTGAQRAELWLAVGDKLVSTATYPAVGDRTDGATPRDVDNLAVLLAEPGTDYVVPVMEGSVLRAVLAIGKPGHPVTPADQRLMRDVANGARLLLWGVAMNAELAERVRRADELAHELQASRQRLARAREVERRRLVTELDNVTTSRLADLRADLANAREALNGAPDDGGDVPGQRPDPEAARAAIARARVELDELLDRFRVIARGVYPAVLRDQGPYGALEEVVADLPRPVRLSGSLPGRLAWEVESGIYYLAASAMRELAGLPARRPLRVHLAHVDARLCARVEDPCPPVSLDELREGLFDEGERLAALGGALDLRDDDGGGLVLDAWLPDELEPTVDLAGQPSRAGSDAAEADSIGAR